LFEWGYSPFFEYKADRAESRHGVSGATKKVPTNNTLPDGTVKPVSQRSSFRRIKPQQVEYR
jgi:hypothetical protein